MTGTVKEGTIVTNYWH